MAASYCEVCTCSHDRDSTCILVYLYHPLHSLKHEPGYLYSTLAEREKERGDISNIILIRSDHRAPVRTKSAHYREKLKTIPTALEVLQCAAIPARP